MVFLLTRLFEDKGNVKVHAFKKPGLNVDLIISYFELNIPLTLKCIFEL